jgi:co-chaperonin GroES (HSP10)
MTSQKTWSIQMSEILIGSNPNSPQVVGSYQYTTSDEDKAKQLPAPSGYRILCAIPEVEEEYESGLLKADATINYEEKLATVLFVVNLGPDCYNDKTRFPNGPWCKQGDFVIVRPNAGTRLLIHGREFRMINDDSVEAVVQDPRGIKRA